jgi:excisionase family DNA binding protein
MQVPVHVTSQKITWSLTEIARATGLSVNFLRYEVRRGNLEVRRFGRRVLVRNDELDRYLDTGSRGSKSPAVEDNSVCPL